MSDATVAASPDVPAFIARWKASGGSERANYTSFLSELCDVLEVPRPEPTQTDVSQNAYVFERDVVFQNPDASTSHGRIDLYKRGCFVLEAKQGSEQPDAGADDLSSPAQPVKKIKKGTAVRGTKGWDDAMLRAFGQAEQYARALPGDEGWPPFLIVVDVGHTIELFADFTKSGKTYLQFPDAATYRITVDQLADADQREKLRRVWTDPQSLDPSRRAAKVTRELAERLAKLAKSLEQSKFEPGQVAQFLMRCLFTMFAEDVELIPREGFTDLLKGLRKTPELFPDMVRSLWETMDKGGFSPILKEKLRRFNGGLFEECEALPLTAPQLELLIEASSALWRDVEPAIFGTLLERALDPVERHKLGAHYTPRAYVERLVLPTIMEPLRAEWDAVRAAALAEMHSGKPADAVATVREYLQHLCHVRILDPACGSGNFLYVALEHMKRLEGEVLAFLRDLGERQTELMTVDPHQFLGIEVNPRAAAIADLVLWIGYLQWHLRTRAKELIPEPVIHKFHNIDCRDAVLAWDAVEELQDADGQPVTRWDGRTMKTHAVTGELVPDETARVAVLKYINPRKADWPQADYIVGNPPFIGKREIRGDLGAGYVDALRAAFGELPDTCDYVMCWWHKAALAVANKTATAFGLITTNGIRQEFNRWAINHHMISPSPVFLSYAVPDHPWVDSAGAADVRISMTVGSASLKPGVLESLATVRGGTERSDSDAFTRTVGLIQPDLTIGANVLSAEKLQSNRGLCAVGFQFNGKGFVISREAAVRFGLGTIPKLDSYIRPFMGTSDMTSRSREALMIDLYGLTLADVMADWPYLYQHILHNVKPERDVNPRESRRKRWWIFGEPLAPFRPAMSGLNRMIGTPITSKHRLFIFLPRNTHVDSTAIMIASDDSHMLGTLSSRIHTVWALRAGSRLGVGNDPRYNKTRCFDAFPFPVTSGVQQQHIGELAEQLDAHRKKQQAAHPGLTLTGMYNVLEKLRSGEPLTAKEKTIHEQGLVSVLKQLHDDLDAAVFEAYGWPVTLTDEEILERLVALNAERAAEEERGLIRWLRPEFQNPAGGKGAVQKQLDVEEDEEAAKPAKKKPAKAAAAKKQPWPKKLAEQAAAVAQALQAAKKPVTPADVGQVFMRANSDDVVRLLEMLAAIGKARTINGGKYVAS